MGQALTIRHARPEDAARLSDLCMRSKQSNGYDDAFMALCANELRITVEQIKQHIFLVADRSDELLGCACLSRTDNNGVGEIAHFFIEPNAKRQGIGRRLLQNILGEARTQGFSQLHLSADPQAEPFYRAMGFTTVGQVPSGSIPGRFLPQMQIEIRKVP